MVGWSRPRPFPSRTLLPSCSWEFPGPAWLGLLLASLGGHHFPPGDGHPKQETQGRGHCLPSIAPLWHFLKSHFLSQFEAGVSVFKSVSQLLFRSVRVARFCFLFLVFFQGPKCYFPLGGMGAAGPHLQPPTSGRVSRVAKDPPRDLRTSRTAGGPAERSGASLTGKKAEPLQCSFAEFQMCSHLAPATEGKQNKPGLHLRGKLGPTGLESSCGAARELHMTARSSNPGVFRLGSPCKRSKKHPPHSRAL